MASVVNQIRLPRQSLKTAQLDLNLEEADMHLLPHGIHTAHAGAKRLVIISGDTDVMDLALNFSSSLKSVCLTYGCALEETP